MLQLIPGGFLKSVEEDTSPALGGDLDGQSTHSLVNMVGGTFSGTGAFGDIAINSGTTYDIDFSTEEVISAYGRTELHVKPSGAEATIPAMKLVIDTGGTGILANESSFLVLAVGGIDVGQFGTEGADLYFDARLADSDVVFRNDTNQQRMRIRSGGNIGFGWGTSPAFDMHLRKTGTATFMLQPGSGNASMVRFRNGTSSKWAIGNHPTNDTYTISTGTGLAAAKLSILQNGNAGFLTNDPQTVVDINADVFRLRTAKTPASAGDTGDVGSICWDVNYVYVCVATDTWERAALASW